MAATRVNKMPILALAIIFFGIGMALYTHKEGFLSPPPAPPNENLKSVIDYFIKANDDIKKIIAPKINAYETSTPKPNPEDIIIIKANISSLITLMGNTVLFIEQSVPKPIVRIPETMPVTGTMPGTGTMPRTGTMPGTMPRTVPVPGTKPVTMPGAGFVPVTGVGPGGILLGSKDNKFYD